MALTQVLPQVRVFQEFTLAASAIVEPLRALILGPHYEVRTYEKAKSTIGIGAYDKDIDTTYSYPGREAGEVVDQDYVSLWFDDALIKFYDSVVGDGQAFAPTDPNQLIAATPFSFATTATHSRNSGLERDVAAGDWIKVTNSNDLSDQVTSEIRQVIRETIAGSFASSTQDASNQATSTSSETLISAPSASNYTADMDASAYDGAVDGNITDRYTVTVIKSGAVGTAEINVVSDSGLDNELGKVVTVEGAPFAVGDRGLLLTLTGAGTFVAGEAWVFDIVGNFTALGAPTVETTIPFTGPTDTTYIIEVTRGGSSPRVNVRTSTGIEAEETDITLGAWNSIGRYGLEVWFGSGASPVGDSSSVSSSSSSSNSSSSESSQSSSSESTESSTSQEPSSASNSSVSSDTGETSSSSPQSPSSSSPSSGSEDFGEQLCAGDIYYVVATAPTQGRASTLVLAQSLTPTILLESDVNVEIFQKSNIEVTGVRYGVPGVTNFDTDANEITVNSGILYYGSATDPLNGQPIVSGDMYVGYRALSQDWVGSVRSISDVGNIGNFFTDVSPENPLGFGVVQALANANGTDVRFISVATNDLAGYTTAVKKTIEREDVYSFVPLTYDQTIIDLVVSHVNTMSGANKGRWRIAWVTQDLPEEKEIVKGDPDPLLGTITQYSGDAVGTYRLLEMSGGNFLTNGVAAGDEVRYSYGVDGFLNQTYSTDTVDSVISETQLLLLTGPASPVSVASSTEIWRQLDTSGQVEELIAGNTYGDRRVRNVLGGNPDMNGYSGVEDYFLACAYAGLRGGVNPHQGLTNVEVANVDAISFLVEDLDGDQLDELANAGFWLTSQDPDTGTIFCRKQLTTDSTDLNSSEGSVTTNVDSMSYYFKSLLAPYIGRTNNVPSVRALIEAQMKTAIEYLKNGVSTPNLGGQLVSGTIEDIRQHATQADRLVIELDLEIPYALNNIDLYLII